MGNIFDRDRMDVERLISIWERDTQLPFFLNLEELVSFSERVEETLMVIDRSDNPRLIVLETWLLIDFTIRHILLHGLGLNKFDQDKVEVLPQSFSACLKLLKQLKKDQENKIKNPSLDSFGFPGKLLLMIGKDKEFSDKFMKIMHEYYSTYHPEALQVLLYDPHNPNFRNVSDGWLATVSILDESWFSFAGIINSARNKAAHNLHTIELFGKLGIAGENKLDLLKSNCRMYLNKLIFTKSIK